MLATQAPGHPRLILLLVGRLLRGVFTLCIWFACSLALDFADCVCPFVASVGSSLLVSDVASSGGFFGELVWLLRCLSVGIDSFGGEILRLCGFVPLRAPCSWWWHAELRGVVLCFSRRLSPTVVRSSWALCRFVLLAYRRRWVGRWGVLRLEGGPEALGGDAERKCCGIES